MSFPSSLAKPALLALLVGGGALAAGPVQAAFLTDAEGQFVTSSDGSCVHTGDWVPAMGSCPAPTVVTIEQPVTATVALQDAAFFKFDSARLTAQARERLLPLVAAAGDADGIIELKITGHTDPIGGAAYNRKLAMRRARAVRRYLVDQGVPADHIRLVSDGDRYPLVSCASVAGKQHRIQCLAPDRRVDVVAVLRDSFSVASVTFIPPQA